MELDELEKIEHIMVLLKADVRKNMSEVAE